MNAANRWHDHNARRVSATADIMLRFLDFERGKGMRFIASIVAVALVAGSAQAGLVNPLIPSWSGAPNTQFAQWDSFTQASGGANIPDAAGSSPFSLMNFAPGAFVTGSGNLYSINTALYLMIMGGTLGNAASPTQVVMNVATAGSVLNTAGVRLSLFDNTGNLIQFAPSSSELRADAPAQPQGAIQTWAFTWNITSVPFQASGFRVEFGASAPSMSLDAVRLDMQYVPAPGALALLAISAFTAGRRRR